MQCRVKNRSRAVGIPSRLFPSFTSRPFRSPHYQQFVAIAFVLVAFCSLIISFSPRTARSADSDLERVQRLLQAGRTQEALKTVDAYLAKHPDDAQGLFKKGIILAQMTQVEQAIAIFDRLTKDYPELPEPYNNLAVLHSTRGEFEQARQVLLNAIKAHPSYATAHENLGDVYVNLAGMSYERAIEIEQGNAKVQTKLAQINDLSSPTSQSRPAQVQTSIVTSSALTMPSSDTNAVTISLPQSDETKLVLSTIDNWARAWSAKDANTYLSFYAADFQPIPNMSRATWEALRRRRIAKPRTIAIAIDDPKVEFADSTDALVTFGQTYRSNVFSDRVRKRLQLRKQGNQWQIYHEQVIGK